MTTTDVSVCRPVRSFARVRAGRIVEVRVLPLADTTDVESLNAEVFEALHRVGPGALVYADHRFASPIARDVADAWARGMRAANLNVSRSAILLDPLNTTFNLQIERVVRCTLHSARRLFWTSEALHAWMDDEKTDLERSALAALFADHPARIPR